MAKASPRTIFITGVSSGLGRAFAAGALNAGHCVVGTVRRPQDVGAFEALEPKRAYGVVLDVTNFDSIPGKIFGIEQSIGPI
jgi:NAD(P)-dependent dehydrogenase (short-subunit alcohol dehydrogenase family)